jgi:hypothetical protein
MASVHPVRPQRNELMYEHTSLVVGLDGNTPSYNTVHW